jgi:4-amino-4-deoxy-L-arabinose transferase-like glycosyltransferase
MRTFNNAALVACVLSIILAFHVVVAWQDFSVLARNGFLYDDSFYAFKIAQSIAAGKGFTFDGIHATTGFQPLYVFLLVPAFLVSGNDPVLPIHIALSLLAVVTCLTSYLLYKTARRYVGLGASLAAAVIWAFSPVVIRQGANGLETAITAFLIALSFYYYVTAVRSAERVPARRYVILGLLLGCAVLSRIDSLLLALVILLDCLLRLRKAEGSERRVAPLLLLPLGLLIVYGPWFFFSLVESGSPLQDSGIATRFLSLAYAPYFQNGSDGLAQTGPDRSFLWAQVIHSLGTLKVIPAVHVIFRSIEKIGDFLGAGGRLRFAGSLFGCLLLGGALWSFIGWRRDKAKSRRWEIAVLLAFSVLLFASYSLYIFGGFFFIRYYYPLYLVASLASAFFVQDALDWYRRRGASVRWAAIAGVGVYAVLFFCFSYFQAFRSRPIYPFYDISKWVTQNTTADDTIGVFQCGTIGYLSDRRIINLDGKVNRGALDAIKNGCLESYLDEQGIDVIIDNSEILELFLGISPEKLGSACVSVPHGPMMCPTGWVAVRRPLSADWGEKSTGITGHSSRRGV